jgi:acyl-CoA thioesterase FadM
MAAFPISQYRSYFSCFSDGIIKNLFLISSAIITARSTNLNTLKDSLPQLLENEKTLPDSHYKRLIRFFRMEKPDELVRCILKLIYRLLSDRVRYLVLDGTQWERGSKKVHLLMLCIIYGNIAIPIYWHQLDKKGHSSEKNREALIKEATIYFNLKGKILLADREFVGQEWLNFLVESGIDFVIRMSEICYKNPISESTGAAYSKLQKQAYRRKRGVFKQFQMNGNTFSIVILKNPKMDLKEPLLYFISTLTHKVRITETYRIRWKIETCFKHLKTNGFNLEQLNFRDNDKILLIVAIVVMGYVLSIQQGLVQMRTKMKTFKNCSKTLAISIFRQGLTKIKARVWSFHRFLRLLQEVLAVLHKPSWLIV